METALYNTALDNKFRHLWRLVGNTPMLALEYRYRRKVCTLYVKCEQYNLTGSLKDRMALYVLEQAYRHAAIGPEEIIVEATSGNTGISFAAIGRALGHRVQILMPDWLSRERSEIIRSLGALVIPVSRAEGGFLGSIAKAEALAKTQEGIFLPRQFDNRANVEAHTKTTGREIWLQLQAAEVEPAAFVAGVGTGGTIMGVGSYLKKRRPEIFVHPVEPAESPTLSTGRKTGSHRIQGISDEFIPAILDLAALDKILSVADGDAILMAQKLACELGLAVGISSGANLVAAIRRQQELGGLPVVTVLPDCNKKYLSTDLLKEEPVREDYLSPQVDFLDYHSINRL